MYKDENYKIILTNLEECEQMMTSVKAEKINDSDMDIIMRISESLKNYTKGSILIKDIS